MYIFVSDSSLGFTKTFLELNTFHAKVLSSLDVDELTPSEVKEELSKRRVGSFISGKKIVLIFKKI
tara:strand:- start:870 stop:1067 length:198 start_codon:yes stop_codon:yes gene_type:complete